MAWEGVRRPTRGEKYLPAVGILWYDERIVRKGGLEPIQEDRERLGKIQVLEIGAIGALTMLGVTYWPQIKHCAESLWDKIA